MSKTTSKNNTDHDTSGLSVYFRLLQYLKQHALLFLVAAFGLAVAGLSQLAFTVMLIPLIDEAFVADAQNDLLWLPLAIAGIFIVRSIGNFLGLYYVGSIGQKVVKELRGEMHAKLLYAPVSFYDSSKLGTILSKFSFDVERVAWAASKSIPIFVRDTLTVISLLVWMLYLSWKLTFILFIAAPLVYIVIRYATMRFRKLSHRIQTSTGDITTRVEEAITAQSIVKLFTAEQSEIDRFDKINDKNRRNQTKFIAVKAVNSPLVQLIVGVAFAVVIYVAFMPSVKVDLTPGIFASFVTAVMGMLNSARKLTTINQILQAGIAASESVFNLIDQPSQENNGSVVLNHCQGNVEFKQVKFKYNSKPDLILNDVSLSAKKNEMIALVGKSGSGKSTLVKLIPRFYEASLGEIRIDGHLIKDIELKSLRNNISMVSQDVILLNDTIENNIAYAMPNKTRNEVIRAAQQAHLIEFIESLPDKYQTLVGDKGVLLSGGQRQRIAIARALLKDAPILILDEATSSLDSESEYYIQEAINELRKNRTTFVIAHRLSTIESADRIYVLDKGEIIQHGSHVDLVKREGAYANLYHRQFKNDDEE